MGILSGITNLCFYALQFICCPRVLVRVAQGKRWLAVGLQQTHLKFRRIGDRTRGFQPGM